MDRTKGLASAALVIVVVLGATLGALGSRSPACELGPAPASPVASPRAQTRAAPREPGTTLVVLKVSRSTVSLVLSTEKPVAFTASPGLPGGASWRLEDPATGRLLAQGPLELPVLCRCGAAGNHAAGCVVVAHEAVVRLKLPRLAPDERLRLLDAGRELATFDLEAKS